MTTVPSDPSTPSDVSASFAPATEPVAPPEPAASSSATFPAAPRRAWLLPAVTGVVGLVFGAALMAAVTAVGADSGQSALLSDAVEACDVASTYGIELADEGRSITFDMKGEDESAGADVTDIACLFGELDMPSAVMSHIDQTTSMDGRQTETWGDLKISWSYHPDRGLDGVLTVGDE